MSLQQRDIYIRQIFSTVAPYVDILSSGFSFGFDHLWRRKAVFLSGAHSGERILDVCTGTGELALLLARRAGPTGSVVGADFCEEMLVRARKKTNSGCAGVSYVLSDAKSLPFPDNSFDLVTVAFGMRNIPDTILALTEIRRVLKPGGRFLCLELTKPGIRWFLRLYQWYISRIMPFIGKLVVKTSTPYLYLPKSIEAYYQPDEFRRVIAERGFSDVTVYSLTMGVATIYRAVKNEYG